jgi:hypothetical protein
MLKVVLTIIFLGVAFGFDPSLPTDMPTARDPLKWPFASWSIWNLPLGNNAKFVPAHLNFTSSLTIEPDPDLIFLDPKQPTTDYMYSSAGWSGVSRCEPTSPSRVLFSAPYPANFIVPSDGNNYGAAILMPDNQTIKQTQPVCRCTANGPVTSRSVFPDVNLYTDGIRGAHGGSSLSAIGGTIRLGEFIPDSNGVVQSVRHVLKSNLWAHESYYREGCDKSSCYRWPATTCDSYFCSNGTHIYGGTNPAVRPGSLLALDFSVDIQKLGLKTTPAQSLAWTLQNYGLYLVDDSAWNAIALETETSPEGVYTEQFQKAWGFEFRSNNNEWARDLQIIYKTLSVVDNWTENVYQQVQASNGSQGVGGGSPRQPWAPSI